MTREDIEKAKELIDQIELFQSVASMLEQTISFERSGGVEKRKSGFSLDKFLSFIRFTNSAKKLGDEIGGRIIIFRGFTPVHGYDLPVDIEIIEGVHKLIKNRLEAKEKELEMIGCSRKE